MHVCKANNKKARFSSKGCHAHHRNILRKFYVNHTPIMVTKKFDLLHDDKVDDNIARDEIDEWSITVKANHELHDHSERNKSGWLTQKC